MKTIFTFEEVHALLKNSSSIDQAKIKLLDEMAKPVPVEPASIPVLPAKIPELDYSHVVKPASKEPRHYQLVKRILTGNPAGLNVNKLHKRMLKTVQTGYSQAKVCCDYGVKVGELVFVKGSGNSYSIGKYKVK